jgi:dsRNA-specific ribonuclease
VLGKVSYQRLEFLGDALMDVMVSLRLLASGHATQ